MAQYFLSQNPTIQNFGASNTTQDTFVINTASDSSLSINQIGTNVVVTDGTYTATFDNFSLEQFSTYANDQQIFNTFDGSQIIFGTATPDSISDIGSATNDYIAGLAGNDSIYGGSGSDVIYGNQGDDFIVSGDTALPEEAVKAAAVGTGSSSDNTVFGGQGNDIVYNEGTGNNAIYGNLGNDILLNFSTGNDKLFGGQGSDIIESIAGNSTMSGGLGDDFIYSGLAGGFGSDTNASSANLIYGNQGNDQIAGFGLKDTVFGGQGNDIVNYDNVVHGTVGSGVASGALIYGNLGNDLITGSTAGDTLFGGQGDDFIVGNVNGVANVGGGGGLGGNGGVPEGLGNNLAAAAAQPTGVTGHDVMTGGLGADTFVQTAATTGSTTATADVITDFVSGTDKIEGNVAGSSANFTAILANGQGDANTVTNATEAVAAAGGAGGNTYTFVAGKSDGYLVETDGAGAVGVTTLTGDNSLAGMKFTDIIGGADTVPGGGTVA